MNQNYSYRDGWLGVLLLIVLAVCWLYGNRLKAMLGWRLHRLNVWLLDRNNPRLKQLARAALAEQATHFTTRVVRKGLTSAWFYRVVAGAVEVRYCEMESDQTLSALSDAWIGGWKPHGEASVPKDACPIKWLLESSQA